MKKFWLIAILLVIYGCPSGGDDSPLQTAMYHEYTIEFIDKCYVIEPVDEGYLIDCQDETWFVYSDLVAKVHDEFTVTFVFGSLEDGLYELMDMIVIDHYSW